MLRFNRSIFVIYPLAMPTMQNAKRKMHNEGIAFGDDFKIHFRRNYIHFAFVILNFAFHTITLYAVYARG